MKSKTNTTNKKSTLVAKASKQKLSLERVIGCTSTHNGSFVCSPSGEIAYPAGCVIVVYNPKRNKQTRFFMSKSNKPIVSLCWSDNGKYLAAGESGHQPSIVVWDVTTKQIVSEFKLHKYGVASLVFSPDMKYIASVGFQHDGFLYITDWRSQNSVACNKVSSKVYAMAFCEDSSYFVTVGFRHVKFWNFDLSAKDKNSTGKKSEVIEGRSGIFGTHRDSIFLDVAVGKGELKNNVYCVTTKGLLCCFAAGSKLLEKWVNLKTDGAFAVSVTDRYVVCGGSNGIVRIFDPNTLEYVTTLPKPHSLGKEFIGKESVSCLPASNSEVYPDTICCKLTGDSQRLSCFYSDRSLFVWDLKNIKKIGKYRSFLAHSACIWDIEVCPNSSCFPPGSFVTASADSTIRIWNLEGNTVEGKRNVFSKEILRTIYSGEDLTTMKAKDYSLRASTELPPTVSEGGIRCIKISPDGAHLASGDRQGNLRVYDMATLDCLSIKEAHDAEILSLDYSQPRSPNDAYLLASASRDRLIHVFDAENNYQLLNTVDDHSSSITCIKFANGGSKLLSCSADKSIVFRDVKKDPFSVSRYHQAISTYGTVYDMDGDATSKYIVTCGQDKRLNIYTIATGKPSRSYKADSDCGELIKVKLDPSGLYASTSSSDKGIRLYDFYSGECLAKAYGHSEPVTGLTFTNDCKKLISVSADGCIFVWKLSADITKNIQERLAELQQNNPLAPVLKHVNSIFNKPAPEQLFPNTDSTVQASESPDTSKVELEQVKLDFSEFQENESNLRLSDSTLPAWALGKPAAQKERKPMMPRGRWGMRVGNEGLPLFSELQDDSPVRGGPIRRFPSEIESVEQEKENITEKEVPVIAVKGKEEDSKSALNPLAEISNIATVVESRTLNNSAKDITSIVLPKPEDEDDILYASESEEDEENEAEAEENPENDILYLQPDGTSAAFQATIQETKETEKVKTESSEDEAVEEPTSPTADSEVFGDFNNADFLSANFESLASKQTNANPTRLSISAMYLAKPQEGSGASTTEGDGDLLPAADLDVPTVDAPTEDPRSIVLKQKQEEMQKEVEKTRQRLASMGLLEADNKQTPASPVETEKTPNTPTAPPSVVVHEPEMGLELTIQAEVINEPSELDTKDESDTGEKDQGITDVRELLKAVDKLQELSLPSDPESVDEEILPSTPKAPEQDDTVVHKLDIKLPHPKVILPEVIIEPKEAWTASQEESNTKDTVEELDSPKICEESIPPVQGTNYTQCKCDVISPQVEVNKTCENDECTAVIAELTNALQRATSLYDRMKENSQANSGAISSLVSAFTSVQQQLGSIVSPATPANLDQTETIFTTSTAFPNASASLLSTSVDLSRTLETYSSMLIEMVKQKLEASK